MSRTNGQNGKRKLQPLRGERPPHVEGRMRRRCLIEKMQRWKEEDQGDGEEAHRSWQELKRMLRG